MVVARSQLKTFWQRLVQPDSPSSHSTNLLQKEQGLSVYIHQIYYSGPTAKNLDPGFIPLDNTLNPRPDWREYHPIRNFLLNNSLQEQSYYGFFSHKFKAKTNLDAKKVLSFIEEDTRPDVIFFSPFCDMQSLFLNPFLQGDFLHPGLLNCTKQLLPKLGISADLNQLVMDSSNTIFCNYFVAKPKFWQAWLDANEKLYALAESKNDLYEQLNKSTEHEKAQIKVFIMERMASLLLATDARWTTRSYNPFNISISRIAPFCDHLDLAIVCDALKLAYRLHPYAAYMKRYKALIAESLIPQETNSN